MLPRELHEENRLSWNAATVAHNSHKGDQAAFFRSGGSSLFPEERELLGDIRGLSLVHLQCNAGQDTLSLAQLGATVTGVDISDTAIDFARTLAAESGVPATFHRADVYDWLEEAATGPVRYDIVFCSYGALCWLSDLDIWARDVAAILKPGGRFAVVEFHPVMQMFDEHYARIYSYFAEGQVLTWDGGIHDYVADSKDGLIRGEYVEGIIDFKNPYRNHEFQWGIGEVASALLGAGLALTTLREYSFSNGFKPFEEMRELPGRRWTVSDGMPNMPLMFALAAQKS